MTINRCLVLICIHLSLIYGQETGKIIERNPSNLPPPFVGPDFNEGKQDYADYLGNNGEQQSLDYDLRKNDSDLLKVDKSGPKIKTVSSESKPSKAKTVVKLEKKDGVKYGQTQVVPRYNFIRNNQTFIRYDIIIPMEVAASKKGPQKH